MNEYEIKAFEEIQIWKKKLLKQPGFINQISKKAQTKVNSMIPEKVHQVITDSIKNMVKATLFGSNLIQNKKQTVGLSLEEKDNHLRGKLSSYRKTAVVEGAGTGAGGILLGLADFPLLLSIKMKIFV